MSPKKHPNKAIRDAIAEAVASGWSLVEAGGSAHCFCRLRCGIPEHSDHMMSVWSTPKNPENHARQILRKVRQCKPNRDGTKVLNKLLNKQLHLKKSGEPI